MADIFSKEERSKRMSLIRSQNTKLEVAFLKAASAVLYPRGYRYRKHYKALLGTPDFVFVSHKVVVFVDGDFWHGRNFRKLRLRLKKGFWIDKIIRNIQRDRKINRALRREGWVVLRFWEGEIEKNPAPAIAQIEAALKKARRRPRKKL